MGFPEIGKQYHPSVDGTPNRASVRVIEPDFLVGRVGVAGNGCIIRRLRKLNLISFAFCLLILALRYRVSLAEEPSGGHHGSLKLAWEQVEHTWERETRGKYGAFRSIVFDTD